MNWDNLSKTQKLDYIVKYMDMESSLEDLQDDVLQIIIFNDLVDDWWTTEENDLQEQEWKKLHYNQKLKAIETEIEGWDKIALIEFLVDYMSLEQIENFKVIFESNK